MENEFIKGESSGISVVVAWNCGCSRIVATESHLFWLLLELTYAECNRRTVVIIAPKKRRCQDSHLITNSGGRRRAVVHKYLVYVVAELVSQANPVIADVDNLDETATRFFSWETRQRLYLDADSETRWLQACNIGACCLKVEQQRSRSSFDNFDAKLSYTTLFVVKRIIFAAELEIRYFDWRHLLDFRGRHVSGNELISGSCLCLLRVSFGGRSLAFNLPFTFLRTSRKKADGRCLSSVSTSVFISQK